jgi:hypothetical protein
MQTLETVESMHAKLRQESVRSPGAQLFMLFITIVFLSIFGAPNAEMSIFLKLLEMLLVLGFAVLFYLLAFRSEDSLDQQFANSARGGQLLNQATLLMQTKRRLRQDLIACQRLSRRYGDNCTKELREEIIAAQAALDVEAQALLARQNELRLELQQATTKVE